MAATPVCEVAEGDCGPRIREYDVWCVVCGVWRVACGVWREACECLDSNSCGSGNAQTAAHALVYCHLNVLPFTRYKLHLQPGWYSLDTAREIDESIETGPQHETLNEIHESFDQ